MKNFLRTSLRDLKILSYNTHLFEKTYPGITQSKLDGERRKQIAKITREKSPVWDQSTKNSLIQELGEDYPYCVHFTHTLSVSDGFPLLEFEIGDGLLICSKYPLYNGEMVEYKNLNGWDQMSHKSAYGVCVKYSGENDIETNFRLFFTHPQAGGGKTDVDDRSRNLHQLKFLTEVYFPDSPTIVCGDMNVNGTADEYSELLMTLFDGYTDMGIAKSENTVDPATNTLAEYWGGNPMRLDYILTKNGISGGTFEVQHDWKIQQPEVCDTSDHFPVMAVDLKVTPYDIPVHSLNTYDEATASALKAKKRYGRGVSNKIRISNHTENYRLELLGSLNQSYDGAYQYAYPSPLIDPGNFGSAFHRHPNFSAYGSCGGMVYRIYDGNDKEVSDVFFGFYAPWCAFGELNNHVYVEAGGIDHYFQRGVMKGLERKVKRSDNSHDCLVGDSLMLMGEIQNKKTSPYTDFFVEEL